MSNAMEVVILTKSSKNGGYCVAGVDHNNGTWIRLVSSDDASSGALFDRHMKYEDGSACKILDIARVPIIGPEEGTYQKENVLIDEGKRWEKIGRLSVGELLNLHPAEKHRYLLGNAYCYITKDAIGTVGHSLVLVQASNLVITQSPERKTKADFLYRGTSYRNMSVTDPDYYTVPDKTEIKSAILVMSLPDTPVNERYYYKFVAKIFRN